MWDFLDRFLNKFKVRTKEKRECIHYIGGKYVNICEGDDYNNIDDYIESDDSMGNLGKVNVNKDMKVLEEKEEKKLDNNEYFNIGESNKEYRMTGKRGRPKNSIIEEYERSLRLNLSKNTQIAYMRAIKFWNGIAKESNKSIYLLEAQEIEVALEKYSDRTRVQKLSALRRLAKIYIRNDYPKLTAQLEKIIINPRGKQEIVKYLSQDRCLELKKSINQGLLDGKREYLWLGLFLFCGLRRGEVETIIIENDKFLKILGKGSKERLVPCPSKLIKALKAIPRDGKGGWKQNGYTLDKALRRKGLLDDFHCHQLRHTYATNLYRRGLDINVIKEVLGHTTILTTQIYAKAKVDESILDYVDF